MYKAVSRVSSVTLVILAAIGLDRLICNYKLIKRRKDHRIKYGERTPVSYLKET